MGLQDSGTFLSLKLPQIQLSRIRGLSGQKEKQEQKQGPIAVAREFLSIHRTIDQLQKKTILPQSVKEIVERTNVLVGQFETLIMQAESQGIDDTMIRIIDDLGKKFTELQKVGLTDFQFFRKLEQGLPRCL
jgi:hypothetical protein